MCLRQNRPRVWTDSILSSLRMAFGLEMKKVIHINYDLMFSWIPPIKMLMLDFDELKKVYTAPESQLKIALFFIFSKPEEWIMQKRASYATNETVWHFYERKAQIGVTRNIFTWDVARWITLERAPALMPYILLLSSSSARPPLN